MKASDINKVLLTKKEENCSVPMLEGEIQGALVWHHKLNEKKEMTFEPSAELIRIFFLCSGTVAFHQGKKDWLYEEKAVFVSKPEEGTVLKAVTEAELIEIQWRLTDEDKAQLASCATDFPVTGRYLEAVQYRDPFKSEKTISRAIIPQRIIPRFAMGSVETYGEDLIGQHEHPLLDQFFFSFPENDMILLLDDLEHPMGGDTLLHIPLGCNHGVRVEPGQCAHYIWIDFVAGEEGNRYLDEVHKETGSIRRFS